EGLRALVDLDARDDAPRFEQLRERRPVMTALADRLVVQDDAADVLLDARRREEHVSVRAARVLGRLEADRVETLLDRPGALVRSEDSLALGDERLRGLVQLVVGHCRLLPFGFRPQRYRHSAGRESVFSRDRKKAARDGS